MTESSAGSKPAKSELTKKRIMETYLAIVPCKKWDKITVREICAGANITRGTFYQYYSDIYDLMEQIENALIDDLTEKYHAIVKHPKTFYPPERFEEKFDYSPPRFLNVWFEFCRNNRKAMAVLLDPQNGDTYFVKKLKGILKDYINTMMDDDGMPRDCLLYTSFLSVLLPPALSESRYLSGLPIQQSSKYLDLMPPEIRFFQGRLLPFLSSCE